MEPVGNIDLQKLVQLEPEEVLVQLQTRTTGLSNQEVLERRDHFGANRLESPSQWTWFRALLRHFLNFFSVLLDVAAGVCFIAEVIDPGQGMGLLGWALLTVSMLNALFAFAQEMRAERAMEELKKFLPQYVRVRRQSGVGSALSEELVPGDLVLIGEGDRIPADARLIESEGLLVDNSPLTGEARTHALSHRPSHRKSYRESRNLVFAGCSVIRGNAVAVVVAIGHQTEFGRIAALSRDIARPESHLEQETKRMIRILTVIAVTMGLLFFAYGVAAGRPLHVNIVFMLGIIVANVPEGLIPTFTLALSMASLRMARKNVLVKSLDVVETLGVVQVICTDKTGTLTRNELSIAALIDAVTGQEIEEDQTHRLLKAALIGSEVREVGQAPAYGSHYAWQGDPLDVAIIERFEKCFGSSGHLRNAIQRHFPFDIHKRREAGIYAAGPQILFAVKGAWEGIRPLVKDIECARDGVKRSANEDSLNRADQVVSQQAQHGRRVIAVASRELSELPSPHAPEESLEKSLTLQGFLAVEDPLRDEVPSAIQRCHAAGIHVTMITGDHPETAWAIAKECGIACASDVQNNSLMTGQVLDSLTDDELLWRLKSGVKVFARTTPEQKLKIVSALKRDGRIVAMTGDGVNDAPALKASDVGIAMGRTGTDVARESSEIVLLDDNFASIVSGIEEGRTIFTNIQKFTTYVLASNIPEITPFLLYILLPVPLALTVVQILSIDLFTDLLPAIGLGQEPPEHDAMQHQPRSKNERLLSWSVMSTSYLFLGLIESVCSLSLFFLVLTYGGWQWGDPLETESHLYRSATGITLCSIILMQIGNVVGRRSLEESGLDSTLLTNPFILAGIGIEIVLSYAILFWDPIRKLLGTDHVTWTFYALAWTGIPIIFGLDLIRKHLLRVSRGGFKTAGLRTSSCEKTDRAVWKSPSSGG